MWRWLERTEDPRSLAAFRLALGSCVLFDVLTLWPHRAYLYGAHGIAPAAEVCTEGLRSLSLLCQATASAASTGLLVALLVATALFTVGAFTRISKWVTAALFASLVLRNAYGVAGWAKTGQTYADGTAFYYMLANDRWFRFEPWWLLSTFGTNALRWATWGAVWFERSVPLVGIALGLGTRWRPNALRATRWIWAPLSVVFTGTLTVLTNIGWFVPAMMASTLVLFRGEELGCLLARCTGRGFVPAVPPSVTRTPWASGVVACLIVWHVFSILVNALALPHLKLEVPLNIRRATRSWARVTNTPQFWGMFSPNAPRSRSWLIVNVVSEDGTIEPAFDDRALLGRRTHPYVFIDRRQKVHSKLRGRNRAVRVRYARYVCTQWRDDNGRPPREVVLARRTWPLPSPGWMAAHGPIDPRPASEPHRREVELLRWACDEGPRPQLRVDPGPP